jgi:hypothetical protein
MKFLFILTATTAISIFSSHLSAQNKTDSTSHGSQKSSKNSYYIDVHQLGPGKVKYEAVAQAHAKDLAVENKYGVRFIKYWVDESGGKIYCLSSSPSPEAITKTHKEAHGLLPDSIYLVTSGHNASPKGNEDFYLDVHQLGAGNVTAKAVAEAHKKDLAVQGKYGVNLINYWVDEKDGIVMCLAQAPDADALVKTHKEAHGLIPVTVMKVKEGK